MTKKVDWEGAAAAAPGTNNPAMGKIVELAEESRTLAEVIEQHQTALTDATTRYNFIRTEELPSAMAEAGTGMWRSQMGDIEVEMKEFVSGSLPKADDKEGEKKRKAATDWIDKNGGQALIKTTITISFDKKEHSKAKQLFAALRKQKYNVKIESGVHPQTLQAWVRERLRSGQKVAADVLGLTIGNYAAITFPDGQVSDPKSKKKGKK